MRLVIPGVVTLLIFACSAWVRLEDQDRYATADEGFWMQRSVRFGAALARGDLASTFRVGHPGATVMWAGVIGIGPSRLEPFLPERFTRHVVLEREPGYQEAFAAARRSVAVINAGLVTVSVLLAWRLLGIGPTLFGGTLLVLNPFTIGITRLLHVESLLAPLMTVSALAGLLYWTKAPHTRYLLLSAVTAGLAFLTKAPSGFLAIFFGLVCLGAVWGPRRRSWPHVLLTLAAWGAAAAATALLVFPAFWVDPVGRIEIILRYLVRVGLQPHDGNFFLGQPVLEDPGLFYYAVAIPLRLSPLVAVGLGLLALREHPCEDRAATRWLLLYVALFVVLMTLASKKFDRYMLPALMMLDLLAGVGLGRLAWLVSRTARTPRPPLLAALLLAIVVVQVGLLARVWPYPIAYYNPLAGGAERARQLIMVGWGEGLDQAATYLNGLPDAERLVVVSSYSHVVRPRFVGVTLPISAYRDPRNAGRLPEPDYVVEYVNNAQRRQIRPLEGRTDVYDEPVFVAHVNGLPYAWVYQVPRNGPRGVAPVPAGPPSDEETETEN